MAATRTASTVSDRSTPPEFLPPPHAATSGTLGRSAGRGQASVSAFAGQAGGRASAAHAPPPAPCFPFPAWCPWAGGLSEGSAPRPAPMPLQMLLHVKQLLVQSFTNVVASETVAGVSIYKCTVSLAALTGITPHEVAAPTKERRAARPTTAGK